MNLFPNAYGKCALALASTVFYAQSGTAAITDLIVNGGFETGDFSGWTQESGGNPQSITMQTPFAGSFSANLFNNNPSANLLKQLEVGKGQVTAGQEVTVSLNYRGTATAGGVFFVELFSIDGGGGVTKTEILGGAPLFPNGDANIWTPVSFTTTAGPDVTNGLTLQLNAACGADAGCVADYYIDNISLTADVAGSVVPLPAGLWLFASSLLGLQGLRRAVRK